MSISVQYNSLTQPFSNGSLAPNFRDQSRWREWSDERAVRNQARLDEILRPKTFDEVLAEMRAQFGDDAQRQLEETERELKAQYELLEQRKREHERLMNEPIDLTQQIMPLIMLGAFTGEMETAAMGALMQMLMLPQLEQQKRDRHWQAIVDLMTEQNKVTAALRSWQSLSLRERQAIISQARQMFGQLTDQTLRDLNMLATQRMREMRIELNRERDTQRQQQIALRYYNQLYDDLLRTLEMYPNVQSRSEIIQAFWPTLTEMAQRAGLSIAPHQSLGKVLAAPSVQSAARLGQLALAAQRMELNQMMYHAAQLNLVQRQIAIRNGLNQMRGLLRRGQTLSPATLFAIYNFTKWVPTEVAAESVAGRESPMRRELENALGSDWMEQLRIIRGQIAAHIVQAAAETAPNQVANTPATVQNAAEDSQLFNQYLAIVAGVPNLSDLELDEPAIEFLRSVFGDSVTRVAMPGMVGTMRFSDFVQNLQRQAQLAMGSAAGLVDPFTGQELPNLTQPSSPPLQPATPTVGAAETPATGGALMPNASSQPVQNIATRPLSSLMIPNSSASNILDVTKLAESINAGAYIEAENVPPEVNRALVNIQRRHIYQAARPDGQLEPLYLPAVGFSQRIDGADERLFIGLHAHHPIHDTQSGRTLIAVSVPVVSMRFQTPEGERRYDLTPQLRTILYQDSVLSNGTTLTDVDLVLIDTPDGRQPLLVVSRLYPVQVGGRTMGYRVPMLYLSPQQFATMMQNRIAQNGWRQYGLPNRYRIGEQNASMQTLLAQFAPDGAWTTTFNEIERILKDSSIPDDSQRTARVMAHWRQLRANLKLADGRDLFRSILWMPITYH